MTTCTLHETAAHSASDSRVTFAFDGNAGNVLRRHFETDANSTELSTTFKLYYQLRPFIPIRIRQTLQRQRNSDMEVDPEWYIPREFINEFRDAVSQDDPKTAAPFIHPWPDGQRMATVLTHDVETADGVKRIDRLAKLEESLGFRSSWNLVPHKYAIDDGLVRDLRDRGHEIGVHGYNHDGKLFFSKQTFRRRAEKINKAMERFDAVGFRAPMVHRRLSWIQDLDVQYDASCFDIDPFQAMPGGLGGIWPFMFGDMVELPYTLPQDHTLLISLGEQTIETWTQKLTFLKKWAGMAMLITHPDYLDTSNRLSIYERLLAYLAEETEAWRALPVEVSQWWQNRHQSSVGTVGQISGPAACRGTVTDFQRLFPTL